MASRPSHHSSGSVPIANEPACREKASTMPLASNASQFLNIRSIKDTSSGAGSMLEDTVSETAGRLSGSPSQHSQRALVACSG